MKAQVIFLTLRVALITILLWAVNLTPVFAGGVVTNCSSDTQFSSLLVGGGTVTFNCGTALIHLSSTKTISADTTIDGGGKITLSGDNARRLFSVNGGVLTLRNIVLTNGFHTGDGGAIYNNSALTLENSTIRNSTASASGGAIVSYGPLHILNSVLEGNQALNGGALYPRFSNAQTTIVNSVLRNNRATDTTNGWGGAILAWDGALVTIQDSDITGNRAHIGGGIYNFANSVLFLGGTRLQDNIVTSSGGGLYNDATATLTNVTLSGNLADSLGGGLLNDDGGTATLTNATLSGNSAFAGGGLLNYDGGTATLTNVTLSGNSADYGGGLLNEGGGTATLTNVTFSGNSAFDSGGGLFNTGGGSVTVKNTIMANNPSNENCEGATPVTNNGFNLSSDASCGFGGGRDNINVLLGPLADNGGPTQTHMPKASSPAIDNGSGCPATDQRGAARPVGAACDAGAVECGAVVSAPSSRNIYLPLVVK